MVIARAATGDLRSSEERKLLFSAVHLAFKRPQKISFKLAQFENITTPCARAAKKDGRTWSPASLVRVAKREPDQSASSDAKTVSFEKAVIELVG